MKRRKKATKERDLELLKMTTDYVSRLREDHKTWRKFHEDARHVLRK